MPSAEPEQGHLRDLALFDLGIDSKLRACDLVRLRVRDVCRDDRLAARAMVLQQQTERQVETGITPPTRKALDRTPRRRYSANRNSGSRGASPQRRLLGTTNRRNRP
jgi:hypothetical protein